MLLSMFTRILQDSEDVWVRHSTLKSLVGIWVLCAQGPHKALRHRVALPEISSHKVCVKKSPTPPVTAPSALHCRRSWAAPGITAPQPLPLLVRQTQGIEAPKQHEETSCSAFCNSTLNMPRPSVCYTGKLIWITGGREFGAELLTPHFLSGCF